MFLKRRLFKKLFLSILCCIFFMTYVFQDDENQSRGRSQKRKKLGHLKATDGNENNVQLQENVLRSYYSQLVSKQTNLSLEHEQQQSQFDNKVLLEEQQDINTGIPVRYRSAAEKEALVVNVSESINSDIPPTWLRITDDIYTYSAHWDTRDGLQPAGPVVRVIGILRYQKEHVHDSVGVIFNGNVKEEILNCSCFLWYAGQDSVEGHLQAFIYEEGKKVFVGTYFLCYPPQLPSGVSLDDKQTTVAKNIPYAVSLAPPGTSNNTQKLIYIKSSKESPNNSSGICVRPLFGPYKDVRSMAQFISYYNTVLGISHFYFYDLAVDSSVREFLNQLTTIGVTIKMLPWNLPVNAWEDLWDYGSLSALNDCIYRSAGIHNHIAIVDIDEFIVPRTPVTHLAQVYKNVLKYKHGQEGDAVLILNAFYCTEYEESNKTADTETFSIFRFKKRQVRLWPAGSRSKIIVIPTSVISAGHHMIHKFLSKDLNNRASPKHVSVLHHYRSCLNINLGMDGTGPSLLKQGSVKDAAILKYKQRVLASPIIKDLMQRHIHL